MNEDLEAKIKEWKEFPIHPEVSKAGWEGAVGMLQSGLAIGVEINDMLVLLLANCLLHYERSKASGT
ncbi:MAG: hypothetical protein A2Z21_02010 [Candidatus Fraserbacteria bacterium RBG_16_55_9]|uniref:Uncharacterized protein n=1 Tax=Fraserbacteria sp. (strain RBG_16_55_9) TaxID=1817864 RepID=A0A1F5UP94_FRAXR|nr:MAG: hypothetical protein A2Z21_02010 [Candidatus Fraserbacteria bacterium RBG_16_55_9]